MLTQNLLPLQHDGHRLRAQPRRSPRYDVTSSSSRTLCLLVECTGAEHHKQRKMLNPVFSTKHLREMMPVFRQVITKVRALGRLVRSSAEHVCRRRGLPSPTVCTLRAPVLQSWICFPGWDVPHSRCSDRRAWDTPSILSLKIALTSSQTPSRICCTLSPN